MSALHDVTACSIRGEDEVGLGIEIEIEIDSKNTESCRKMS